MRQHKEKEGKQQGLFEVEGADESNRELARLSQFTKFHARCDKIIFRNDDSSFFITAMSSKSPRGTFTMKTTYPLMAERGIYDVTGEWESSKKHGLQFIAGSVAQAAPDTLFGMEKYLAGNIEGVGRKTARLIVEAFGKSTKDILDSYPQKLYEVKGLKKTVIPKIISSWQERSSINKLYIYMSSLHIDGSVARKVFAKFGKFAIDMIEKNPYCLAEIEGIGFITADNVAREMGFSPDSPFRLRAGIVYTLYTTCFADGNVYMTRKSLADSASRLLSISDAAKIGAQMDCLIEKKIIIQDGDAIYSPSLYNAEDRTARLLVRLMSYHVREISVPDGFRSGDGIEYDEVQMDAIRTAMASKVMVLTGGPGTGKTTTTKGIISAWQAAGLSVLLAAPTGRAAKRLSETTGMEAKTIHRMLCFVGGQFQVDEDCPLSGDALIVDEASMIDVELMSALIRAIPLHMRLVLVGDVDQLPSVGPGNVLRDIIESGVIPVVRLARIFRQAQDSRIITNAHLINEGKPIVYDNSADSDFFFLKDSDNERIAEQIVDMVTHRLPCHYGIRPQDVQVLSPMKKSSNGVAALNTLLQSVVNPSGAEIKYGSTSFRVGDRVMQMRNDYNHDVFNGDTGTILDVDDEEGTVYVDFGREKPVEYDKKMLADLSLAYACTIHKSQGSEFTAVVMPLTMQFYRMLQRNLLYTGVTRAKRVCVLIGDRRAVTAAIGNGSAIKRNTLLKERLNKYKDEYNKQTRKTETDTAG